MRTKYRDLIWLAALLIIIALVAIPHHGQAEPRDYTGHWIRPDGIMVDLSQKGDLLEGVYYEKGWEQTVQIKLSTGRGQMRRADLANNKSTLCQVAFRPRGKGFVMGTTSTDGTLDLPKSYHDEYTYRRHAGGISFALSPFGETPGAFDPCPKESEEPDFNGRWVRPDGTVKILYQEGDEIDGICDSPSWFHKIHIHLTDAQHGEGTMERTHKGSHKTTVCSMRISWQGKGFVLAMTGTDGAIDLPASYREEYTYSRYQIPGAKK